MDETKDNKKVEPSRHVGISKTKKRGTRKN